MNCVSAFRTLKDSLTERHLSGIESALITSMTAPSGLGILSEFSTACYSLVGEHLIESTPTYIEYMFSEIALEHILNVESFTTNYAIIFPERVCEFVEEVCSLIVDFEVLPSQLYSSFFPVVTSLDCSAMVSLESSKFPLSIQVESWIDNTAPLMVCQEFFESNIDSNLGFRMWMFDFRNFDFTGECDVPLSCFVLLDCHSLNFAFRNSVEFDWNVSYFADLQSLITEQLESALWIGDALDSTFESRVSCLNVLSFGSEFTSIEEVGVCFRQSVGNILECLRMDCSKDVC